MKPRLSFLIIAIFILLATAASAQVLPDLNVEEINVSNYGPKSGETIDIMVRVKNIGNNTSAVFRYDLYLTDDKFGERHISTNWYYNKLDVGKAIRTTLQATIFGPSTIKFVVDEGNTIPELNESNNVKTARVGFPEQPQAPIPQEEVVVKQQTAQKEKLSIKSVITSLGDRFDNLVQNSPFLKMLVIGGVVVVIISIATYLASGKSEKEEVEEEKTEQLLFFNFDY